MATLDSFGTVDGLKLYAASYVFEAPDFSEPDDVVIALNQATVVIDGLYFIDEPVSTDHVFPRVQLGTPKPALHALYEIAIKIIDGDDIDLAVETSGVTSVGIANVRVSASSNVSQAHLAAGVISTKAWRFLQPYLRVDRTIQLSRVS